MKKPDYFQNNQPLPVSSRYIGLSTQDDLDPFWQNRIIFEKMPLDSDEIQQILREENHPLSD